MKIGVICEGETTDQVIFEELLKHKFPQVDFHIKGYTKREIFESGDLKLKEFHENGVDRVLIVWDLLPAGSQLGIAVQRSIKPSRKEQREKLLDLLRQSKHLPTKLRDQANYFAFKYEFTNTQYQHPNEEDDLFKLVCVCYSLEGWFLSDEQVLCSLISSNKITISRLDPRLPHPDRCENPVAALIRVFSTQGALKKFKYYNKTDHNKEVIMHYINQDKVDKMRTSSSFCRVVDTISAWVKQ